MRLASCGVKCLNSSSVFQINFSAGLTVLCSEIPHERQAQKRWRSDPSWIIPVRLGFNFNLYKAKIYLVPVLGYSQGINPSFGYGSGSGKQTSSTTTITYNYTENPDVSRYFPLLQTGIGFEFKLFKTLLFSISTNYYSGFKNTTHLDINYTVNNSNQTTGTAISKGQFWCVSTGLKYPISNFWTMKKEHVGP
jgi:hypothetical protein